MKKFLLVCLAVFLFLCLVSCESDTEIDTPADPDIIIEESDPSITPKDEVTEEEEQIVDTKKPDGALEIIAFADEYNLDTSRLGFSLEGILEDTQLSEGDEVGDEYLSSTAYLGDSVTLGLGVFGNHPKELVIAKGSINPLDAVQKKLIELDDTTTVNFPEALSKLDAKRAVLTFGANAISIMSEESFLNAYIMLIDEIKKTCPDCEIIIQSISPIASTATFKKFTNELINRSNLLLLVLAYSKDAHFLNSAPELKDADGYLKIELCSSDDGVHINEAGYNIWINYLKTHPLTEE